MNTLVLEPFAYGRKYSLYSSMSRDPIVQDNSTCITRSASDIFDSAISGVERHEPIDCLDAIALVVPYGGDVFTRSLVATPELLRQFDRIASDAPLHLPLIQELANRILQEIPCVPLVLTFDTAFFSQLEQREHMYALPQEEPRVRRFGYQGLYHEAACRHVRRRQDHKSRDNLRRVISICLAPTSETTAVLGMRPLTVTGGATPLEGLLGETSCGELDPSIVLTLAEKKQWGAEKINDVLTRQSGIKGLTGTHTPLPALYQSNEESFSLARRILEYRLLKSCGAAIAALGGLDAVVFSGPYASLWEELGTWLISRLKLRNAESVDIDFFSETKSRIIADIAEAIITRETQMAG